MRSHKTLARLYHEFEKLFRLSGLYQGGRSQLKQHVKIVDGSLTSLLRGPQSPLPGGRFEFFMLGVFSDGEKIFEGATPESTLGYALYCEGVQTLDVLPGVTGEEILDFCELIRRFFHSNENVHDDLASILWRTPFLNIKVGIYTALSDKDGALSVADDEDRENSKNYKDEDAEKKVESRRWHSRDKDWDAPSAELILRRNPQDDDPSTESVLRLKEELSDASITDRASQIIRFNGEELSLLADEIEILDQTQIEYNLLSHNFEILSEWKETEKSSVLLESILLSTDEIVTSALNRFHGGLLLFVLKTVQQMKRNDTLEKFKKKIEDSFSKTVSSSENLQKLAEALVHPSRFEIGEKLLEFIPLEAFPNLFDMIIETPSSFGRKIIFRHFLKRDPEPDQNIFKWGEARLPLFFNFLSDLQWDRKDRFLAKCLRHPSSSIVNLALQQFSTLNLKTKDAEAILIRLSPSQRKIVAESFLKNELKQNWRELLILWIQSGRWADGQYDLMFLWVRVAFRYLKGEAFTLFEPYVASRKLFLWPKFPEERDAVLSAIVLLKEPEFRNTLESWIDRERSLLFQNGDLKERLSSRRPK